MELLASHYHGATLQVRGLLIESSLESCHSTTFHKAACKKWARHQKSMMTQRHIEIFSAGCPACEDTIKLINETVCGSCSVEILDMNRPDVAKRADQLGVKTVPAVAVDSDLLACCKGGMTQASLHEAGIGKTSS